MIQFLNVWLRRLHRWMAVPLASSIVLTITFVAFKGPESIPGWVSALGILSILTLMASGLYLFVHYYWANFKRPANAPSPLVRRLHRWLVVPQAAAVVLIIGCVVRNGPEAEIPVWMLGMSGISILGLMITGLCMFVQYYRARWKASSVSSSKGATS